MRVEERDLLSRKLSAFIALNDSDLAVLERLHQKRRSFPAGRHLIHEGQTQPAAYVLAAGWVCSYKLHPDGGRQIIGFELPGDFIGLRSILMHSSDCSFESISDTMAVEVPMQFLVEAFAKTPRLATSLLWAASRDETMLVERIVRLGRGDAQKRMAHFLLQLGARLTLVGLGNATGYACPLTQYHLADALGLSPVHVNRVLRSLREAGLVSFREGHVKFMDHAGLVKLADFDPAWLALAHPCG